MTSPLVGLATKINKAFGNVFLDAVLTREIPGSTEPPYSSYDPGPPTPQDFPCKALAEDYGAYSRGQGLVGANDMKVLILAGSLSVDPQPLDKIVISIQGFSGQIVADGTAGTPAVKTDPAKATWECRCSI